ncbi:MAG: hypothetical protein NW217_00015 [Hyphomicrobiaceae bacterium]|nr:hypothetical protein [Hyphomicrobiaceae bacterium]
MRAITLSLLAATLAAVAQPAVSQDFSAGSNAQTLGLTGEVKATFSGKVVDILCELTGDCPADCGAGNRNLGIVRASDGKLVFVAKNAQFEFNGGTDDLLPYCGQMIDVDGLLLGDDPSVPGKIYMMQFVRKSGQNEWKKADLWSAAWDKRNPGAKGEGPWYNRDPRVKKQIERSGYFGLGAAEDQKYWAGNK